MPSVESTLNNASSARFFTIGSVVRQVEKIQHPGPDEKSGGQKEDSGGKNAAIRQIGDKKRNEERDGKNQKRGHVAFTVNRGEEVT